MGMPAVLGRNRKSTGTDFAQAIIYASGEHTADSVTPLRPVADYCHRRTPVLTHKGRRKRVELRTTADQSVLSENGIYMGNRSTDLRAASPS